MNPYANGMTVSDARPVLEANWEYFANMALQDLPAALEGVVAPGV